MHGGGEEGKGKKREKCVYTGREERRKKRKKKRKKTKSIYIYFT